MIWIIGALVVAVVGVFAYLFIEFGKVFHSHWEDK
jgi:hypothetical protein